MMEPDVVTGSGFGETAVGSKGGEELKDELRNSEHNDVRGSKSVEGGEISVVEGGNMDGGEVGGGDAERREENVEAKDGTAREDVDMVETGNVGHAENTFVEGGTEEKVGEEDVERRGESVEAKDETEREDVEMVETGNVGDEGKTSSGGGTEEEVGEEVVERREAKEETTSEDVDVVESGNVDYKERTSIAWGKEKGVGEEDVERREETVEVKEITAMEDSYMVETRIEGRQERNSVEGGEEGEVGRDGDVRREESVEVQESKREDVGMVEGENEENALVGRKEEGEKVSGESDVRREESVEGKDERKEEDLEMAEVANVESGEKVVIEGGIEAEGEELDEGNDARREESVDGKGEDLEIAAAGNVESGEKTAIERGLDAEGEEVGEDNDERREESVEGKEERKREDVGMAEGQNEEGTIIEGGEEDGEEVDEESNAFDEEESEEGEKTDASTEADFSAEKNRAHREKASKKGDTKGEKQSASRGKESPRTPATSLIERPVRERKIVERLVEVIDKEPYKELLLIDKGRGTPLKDIPNVSYKLAKKKSGDLKLLHQTLFGRRGKATNFRNHILQFSGFAWNEDDEKQRAKVKDKLDKYVREILWDFCDLFDIPFSKTTTRKEDLVLKLLDFMVAPHAITDVIIAGKDEPQKTKKRKKVSEGTASKNMDGMLAKGLRKKQDKSERTTAVNSKAEEAEEEDEEDNKNDYESDRHDEGKPYKHSDSDEFENKIEETFDEQDDEQLKNAKRATSRSSKQRGSARKENVGTYPKTPPVTTLKKSSTTTSSENQMEERNDVEVKVFSRKKKNVDALEKMSSFKPDKKEKSASYEHHFEESNDVEVKVFSRKKANDDTPKKTLSSKPVKNEKSTGKKLSTGNGKGGSAPNNEELRKTICEILKEVDFKATTFTDILKLLDTYYKMDLKPKKPAIKVMIQEELTRLADEAIENEDYEDEGAEGFASKNAGGMPLKGSTKKQDGGEHTTAKRKRVDKEDNEKVNESGPPEEGRSFMHSDGDQSESDEPDDKHLKNGRQDTPRSSKQRGSARKEKVGTYPKTSPVTTMKKASETPHSDHRSKGSDDDNVKVFSRKKKSVDAHTKSSFKPTKKEKSTGKKLSTGRGKMGSIPSKEELRKTICEILKEIDFNTATFTDMLKQLTTYYKMDLTPKKSAIKLIIQEELSRLAEEVIENEDSVDEEEQSDDEDDTQPARKKMKV